MIHMRQLIHFSDRQQASLLKFLQERRVKFIAETKERPVDIRLVTASNESIGSLPFSERCEDLKLSRKGSGLGFDGTRGPRAQGDNKGSSKGEYSCNKIAAAKRLVISPRTLYKKMRKLRII